MKRVLFLSIIVAALSSCEEMVTNVDVPQSEPHYVLHGYFSPEDSSVTVSTGKSTPVFGEQITQDTSWINTAQILVNGQALVREGGSWKFSLPAAAMPLVPGQTYPVQLNVGGTIVCTSSCTIPSERNTSLEYNGIDSVQYGEEDYRDYYVLWSFYDLPGNGHYYRVGASVSYIDEYEGDTIQYVLFPEAEHFMTDVNSDGERFSGRMYFHYGQNLGNVLSLTLFLYTTDEDYYFYHRAVLSQNGDDPFSEPVIVPSNIENGLGCIAGCRIYSISVSL